MLLFLFHNHLNAAKRIANVRFTANKHPVRAEEPKQKKAYAKSVDKSQTKRRPPSGKPPFLFLQATSLIASLHKY